MAKEESFEFQGVVEKSLPNATFLVILDNNHSINAHISGQMRKNRIRVIVGDRVTVKVNTYDYSKGIIIYRFKQ